MITPTQLAEIRERHRNGFVECPFEDVANLLALVDELTDEGEGVRRKAKTPRQRITDAVLKLKHPHLEIAPLPYQVINAVMPEVNYLMQRARADERRHLVDLYEGIIKRRDKAHEDNMAEQKRLAARCTELWEQLQAPTPRAVGSETRGIERGWDEREAVAWRRLLRIHKRGFWRGV